MKVVVILGGSSESPCNTCTFFHASSKINSVGTIQSQTVNYLKTPGRRQTIRRPLAHFYYLRILLPNATSCILCRMQDLQWAFKQIQEQRNHMPSSAGTFCKERHAAHMCPAGPKQPGDSDALFKTRARLSAFPETWLEDTD